MDQFWYSPDQVSVHVASIFIDVRFAAQKLKQEWNIDEGEVESFSGHFYCETY